MSAGLPELRQHQRGNPHAPAATPEQIQRALAEARTVTTTEQGGQVELQLGHFCNNRCVFCASGQLTEQGHAAPIPTSTVRAALQAVAARGIRRVTFLGGEPTIQSSFLPGLRAAAELGFEQVVVFTNGARLADARFRDAVEAIVGPAGIAVQWRISLQGADAASHDRAVGLRGAFDRIVRGLQALSDRQQDITVNMCLTSGSVATLPGLAGLLQQFKVRQVCIDMVRPVSAGERDAAWMQAIMPRFSSLAVPLQDLTARLQAVDPHYDVNYTHVPMCTVPELAPLLHHGGEPTVTFTADLDERQGVMDKYAFQATDRRQMRHCGGCVFAWRCSGVAHQYLDWHGEDEFEPHTPALIAGRGLQAAALVDLLHTAVAGWRQCGPWQSLAVHHDQRARRSELQWFDPALPQRRWSLWLAAAEVEPNPGHLVWARWPGGVAALDPTSAAPDAAALAELRESLAERLALVSLGPLEVLGDAKAVASLARHREWLAAALDQLQALPGPWRVQREGGLFRVQWDEGGARHWVSLAAGPSQPVAWQLRDPSLGGGEESLLHLSQALGRALRAAQTRL